MEIANISWWFPWDASLPEDGILTTRQVISLIFHRYCDDVDINDNVNEFSWTVFKLKAIWFISKYAIKNLSKCFRCRDLFTRKIFLASTLIYEAFITAIHIKSHPSQSQPSGFNLWHETFHSSCTANRHPTTQRAHKLHLNNKWRHFMVKEIFIFIIFCRLLHFLHFSSVNPTIWQYSSLNWFILPSSDVPSLHHLGENPF